MTLEMLFIIILAILLGISLYYNYKLFGYVRLLQSALRHTAAQLPKFALIGAVIGFSLSRALNNLQNGEE